MGDNKTASRNKNGFSLLILLLNAALLCFAVMMSGRYLAFYRERLREENLGNIANLNQSAASNATALMDSWNIKLNDIARYLQRHDLTLEQTLQLLEDSNSSEERQFELIGSDYTGYLARRDGDGAFPPLSYAGGSYAELQKAFDDVKDAAFGDVCFAPEFTEDSTALKYFAVYRHVPIRNANGERETHTLLLAARSRDVLAAFNQQSDFAGQSTVLMDASGNYIVSNQDFKSTNFFQYLYVYNDLTLDQRNAIQQEVAARDSGELYYRNAAEQECVFRYVRMTTNNWYCITCVPLSSFRTPAFRISYLALTIVALLLMLVIDVVWFRRMNRQLRVSMEHEKEASEAKTDFLSRMSHDIRTPLNGIIGLTALALDENNPPRTQEYLENVNVSGKFLLGLVNDILDMSKVERGLVELHPEPYTGQDLCRYVGAVVEPLCRDKGVAFRVAPPPRDLPVMLDRLRFNQVIFNLLSNAVKYTPSGGLVELFWTRTPLGNARVALDFTVRDNGIGMSEEFQTRMFEAFSQEHASAANTGTGLGLSIVRSLVGLMGGQITVASRLNEGSEFHVHLETDVCTKMQEEPADEHSSALEGRHVLLCEDNRVNILVAQRLMEKWGIAVDVARNGRLGVEMFAASALGEYDAVLMDVMMPELNGLDATRAIRRLVRPDAATVPVIAMTANAYDTDVQNCLNAGMTVHMGKPIDPQQLRMLLSELIRP